MTRLLPALAIAATVLAGCASHKAPTAPAANAGARLTALMQQYTRDASQYDADIAGANNPRRGAGHLQDMSDAALAARNQHWQQLRQQIAAISNDQLSDQQHIDKTMLLYQLDNRIDSYHFGQQYIPLTSEYGFWVTLANLKSELRFKDPADYDRYLTALADIPRYLAQQTALMREGMQKGITQPKAVLGLAADNIAKYINAEQFLSPFDALPKGDPRKVKATVLVKKEVLPALSQFHDFMLNTYIPGARTSIGMSAMPNGRAWYQNRIKHYVTLDMSPEQIHQLGLQEMARIHQEMDTIIHDQLHFKGSLHDFMTFLRTDPQFYAKTPRQLLMEAAYYAKRADEILPRYFGKLPRKTYGVEPVPADIAANYTTGRYAGSASDDQPGEYWVNTYNLKVRPLYELPALTLHEAVPGHHLQISLTQEQTSLPPFRRNAYISAFGEGWGLYSEHLGIEAGYYRTPYERFGQLIFDAWRAARLVVDTGIHWYGWDRAKALKYMADNTGLSLHNVQTETDRYISWPAQALSYKIGELTILRLRHKAEKALGKHFDIRRFHDALLANGSIPLSTLEREMDRFIASEQQRLSQH